MGYWGIDRDVIFMVKNFIVVDNMEMVSYVIVVFNFYLCVKKDFVFLLRGVIDDFEIF